MSAELDHGERPAGCRRRLKTYAGALELARRKGIKIRPALTLGTGGRIWAWPTCQVRGTSASERGWMRQDESLGASQPRDRRPGTWRAPTLPIGQHSQLSECWSWPCVGGRHRGAGRFCSTGLQVGKGHGDTHDRHYTAHRRSRCGGPDGAVEATSRRGSPVLKLCANRYLLEGAWLELGGELIMRPRNCRDLCGRPESGFIRQRDTGAAVGQPYVWLSRGG